MNSRKNQEIQDKSSIRESQKSPEDLRPIITCDICGKKISFLRHLRRHIATVHQKTKKFKCYFCSRCFNLKTNLKVHIATVHHSSYMKYKNTKNSILYVFYAEKCTQQLQMQETVKISMSFKTTNVENIGNMGNMAIRVIVCHKRGTVGNPEISKT
jgi:predicted transport protein